MKIKTQDLTGAALDWGVAMCEGIRLNEGNTLTNDCDIYAPSTDWAQGGPIIEREVPVLLKTNGGDWIAQGPYDRAKNCESTRYYGPTILIAAMRCYVASKLGDEVNVTDDLV